MSKMAKLNALVCSFILAAMYLEANGKAVNRRISTRSESCCGDLGCFQSGGDFFSLFNRPLNSVPNCNALPKYYLATREQRILHEIDSYNVETIQTSKFNASRRTKVFVHAFLDDYENPWWESMQNEMFIEGDYNIIRVDWTSGNTAPYMQACANARLVGAHIARLIRVLREQFGLDPKDVHMIGHSLGVQVTGYAGERIPGLGRITGLDPAGPYFTGMPASVSLDPTDALFVDTIMTDGKSIFKLGLGTSQTMGHLNFMPNGGVEQPGCDQSILSSYVNGNDDQYGLLLNGVMCNHLRASQFFIDSINNNNQNEYPAFVCDSYESFTNGECFSAEPGNWSPMGFHANGELVQGNQQQKKLFLLTGGLHPYHSANYRVQFMVQSGRDVKKEKGEVSVVLHGTVGKSAKLRLTPKAIEIQPGQMFAFITTTDAVIGDLRAVTISWESDHSILNPFQWSLWRDHILYLDSGVKVQDTAGRTFDFVNGNMEIEDEESSQLFL